MQLYSEGFQLFFTLDWGNFSILRGNGQHFRVLTKYKQRKNLLIPRNFFFLECIHFFILFNKGKIRFFFLNFELFNAKSKHTMSEFDSFNNLSSVINHSTNN